MGPTRDLLPLCDGCSEDLRWRAKWYHVPRLSKRFSGQCHRRQFDVLFFTWRVRWEEKRQTFEIRETCRHMVGYSTCLPYPTYVTLSSIATLDPHHIRPQVLHKPFQVCKLWKPRERDQECVGGATFLLPLPLSLRRVRLDAVPVQCLGNCSSLPSSNFANYFACFKMYIPDFAMWDKALAVFFSNLKGCCCCECL